MSMLEERQDGGAVASIEEFGVAEGAAQFLIDREQIRNAQEKAEQEGNPETREEEPRNELEKALKSLRDGELTDGAPTIGITEGRKLIQAAIADREPYPEEEAALQELHELDDALLDIETGDEQKLDYTTIIKKIRSLFRREVTEWHTISRNQLGLAGFVQPEVIGNLNIYKAIRKDIDRRLRTPESIYSVETPYRFPDIEILKNTLPKNGEPTLDTAYEFFKLVEDDIKAKKAEVEKGNLKLKTQIKAIDKADKYYDDHKNELDENTPLSVTIAHDLNDPEEEPEIKTRIYDHDDSLPEPQEGSYYFIFDPEEDEEYAYGLVELGKLETQVEQALAGIANLQQENPVITSSQIFSIGMLNSRLGEEFGTGTKDDTHEQSFIELQQMVSEKITDAKLIKEPVAA